MFWFFGHEACEILVPWPRMKPAALALEGEVLTTRQPGRFPRSFICINFMLYLWPESYQDIDHILLCILYHLQFHWLN